MYLIERGKVSRRSGRHFDCKKMLILVAFAITIEIQKGTTVGPPITVD